MTNNESGVKVITTALYSTSLNSDSVQVQIHPILNQTLFFPNVTY